jgi:hypothetical protein
VNAEQNGRGRRLQFALVLEVGSLDVVDQPVLGERDGVSRDGGAQTLELGDEVVVRRLVFGLLAVALRVELRLFRLEVADDGV